VRVREAGRFDAGRGFIACKQAPTFSEAGLPVYYDQSPMNGLLPFGMGAASLVTGGRLFAAALFVFFAGAAGAGVVAADFDGGLDGGGTLAERAGEDPVAVEEVELGFFVEGAFDAFLRVVGGEIDIGNTGADFGFVGVDDEARPAEGRGVGVVDERPGR
jgi:hypothetical protein